MSSFEDVDKHVFALGALPVVNPVTPIDQLCPYWKAAKPILELVVALPIFPANWKTVVTGLVTVLDKICP